MQSIVFYCSFLAVLLTSIITITEATVRGQYSVSVHFVSPLVNGECRVGEFWSPPNVICGLCFCMTGRLSRCIPQPGCNPQNSSATTPESMKPPTGNESATDNQGNQQNTGGNQDSGTTQVPDTPGGTESTGSVGDGGSGAPSGGPVENEDTPAKRNKNRGAKPGKSRRRRRSSQ